MTTSEQQAVPVAQELDGFTLGMSVRIRDGVQHFGGLIGYVEKIHEPSPRQYPIEVMLMDRKDSRCFRPHELEVIPHPCKSGEGVDLAVWCAREAEARRAEGNSSPHTAKLTREGRYDDQGVMPVAIEAARIALGLSTPDAPQTREAELVAAAKALLDTLEKHGEWEDARCFYYQGRSASELQQPMQSLRAALNARGGA